MQENGKVTPKEVKGWNWGAFSFNWIWGIGNKTYLPLISLIPLVGFIWNFIVGCKGNEWAWQKGDYDDVTTFKKVQETWNRAGLINFIVSMIVFVFYIIIILLPFLSDMNN